MILPWYLHSIAIICIIYRLWRWFFTKEFLICIFKDQNLAENWTNMAKNQREKKFNSVGLVGFAFPTLPFLALWVVLRSWIKDTWWLLIFGHTGHLCSSSFIKSLICLCIICFDTLLDSLHFYMCCFSSLWVLSISSHTKQTKDPSSCNYLLCHFFQVWYGTF